MHLNESGGNQPDDYGVSGLMIKVATNLHSR
jgi:hypothetical protein